MDGESREGKDRLLHPFELELGEGLCFVVYDPQIRAIPSETHRQENGIPMLIHCAHRHWIDGDNAIVKISGSTEEELSAIRREGVRITIDDGDL